MTAIVSRIAAPRESLRQAIHTGPVTMEAFHASFAELECLRQVEHVPPPAPPQTPLDSVRIAFWNAERLKYLRPSVALLRAAAADASLLCELDLGMARSGDRHTTAELAAGLASGYIFGVEFVELDLGDARERRWHEGETNAAGLHGAALISQHPLLRPALVRLERSGRWFDGAFGERRVGGRIALMAELALASANVLLVSVHYESHTGPRDRLEQTRVMLDAIDAHGPSLPVLIGGDFNTSTFERQDKDRAEAIETALRRDPERLLKPMRYEPMFAELAARGYEWESCNVIGAATQRSRPDSTPAPPFGRIDWFFTRDLDCSDPAVVPAVDADETAISDHELLAVTIRPRRA